MLKIIGSIGLLLTAAYCSYQIIRIRNWQKLLTDKQSQFGVHKTNNNIQIKQLKTWGSTLASAFVLLIVVSQHQLNLNQNARMAPETAKIAPQDTQGTYSLTAPESLKNMQADKFAYSGANAFLYLQKEPEQMDTIVIEPISDDAVRLSHEEWMNLLTKSLEPVTAPMMEEEVVVKVTLKDSSQLVVKLATEEDAWYLIDEEAQALYLMQ